MTTARERYEAKTKVVTFRVSTEVYAQLEAAKQQGGLSFSDLVKLGAGLAQEEIKAKLTEATGLEARIAQDRAALRQTQQEVEKAVDEEKKRRLARLDNLIQAFKLFDQGWTLETVSFKMGISQEIAYCYFQEWGEMRKDKPTLERELLRACIKLHLHKRKEDLSFGKLFPSYPAKKLEEIAEEIDYFEWLLQNPSEVPEDWKDFLLAEYSGKIQATKTMKPG